jgi:hypothetical protein
MFTTKSNHLTTVEAFPRQKETLALQSVRMMWIAVIAVFSLLLHAPAARAETEAATGGVVKESYEFQAEVSRLMDIIINSLYKNKEVCSSHSLRGEFLLIAWLCE